MDLAVFDPADAGSWLARGRTPEHAAALAKAWRDYPDLPPNAPLAEREARGRQRIVAMRPVNDAVRAHGEAQRQATNFAFLENQVREGKANDRDLAILRGRDQHRYGWDVCNLYADGWYAAHVGWPNSYRNGVTCSAPLEVRRAAYDQGFTDGGGDRTDLFDAARRANLAVHRRSNMPPVSSPVPTARPLPSSWPKPGDEARPARWSRRLDQGDTTWNDKKARREQAGAGYKKAVPLGSASWVGKPIKMKASGSGGGAWFAAKNRGFDYQKGRFRPPPPLFKPHPLQGLVLLLSAVGILIPAYREAKRAGWFPDRTPEVAFPATGTVTVSNDVDPRSATSRMLVTGLLEAGSSLYGISTVCLMVVFVVSPGTGREFVKAFTLILFVIASVLAVDGALGIRSGIDRTWRSLRLGTAARLLGIGKLCAAFLAWSLVAIGVIL